MSRGVMKGLDKFRSSQSLMASAMKDCYDKNIDANFSSKKEEEVVSNFDEVVLENEKEPRSIAVIPRKIRVIKVTTKEQPIRNIRETTSELEAIHMDTSINKREVLEPLEPLEHVETVKIVQTLSLPTALRPKEEKKSVRFTTYVDTEVYENIQYLKANGRIQSISSLVTIALIEFIEKYQLIK